MTTLLKNRYRILKKLDSGGFGEAFLAEDTYSPSHRRCVIKQLKPITNNPQVYQLVKERFEREAFILENLGEKIAHIPRLYAYFEENGQFYLIQEWIDGITLTQKVQQGIVSEEVVKNILMQCLSTLIAVHNQGIIHRDIKPDNIILRHSDNQPVLIDFGAVKETIRTEITSSGHQISSIVIGTPGFMPPEQSNGRPIFSSDLYSLALTAIYLLTGKTPDEMESDLITGVIQWRQYAPNISNLFAAILDKAIENYPKDRFLTATEMLNALQSPVNHVSTVLSIAPPPPSSSPARDLSRTPVGNLFPTPAFITDTVKHNTHSQPSPTNTLVFYILLILAGVLIAFTAIIYFVTINNSDPPSISEFSDEGESDTLPPTSSPTSEDLCLKITCWHQNLIPLGDYNFYEKNFQKNVSYRRNGNLMIGALYNSQNPNTYTCFAATIDNTSVNVIWQGNLWQINKTGESLTFNYSIKNFTVDNTNFTKGSDNSLAVQDCLKQF